MKLFKLSMILTVFMLTGALDYLLGAVPWLVMLWMAASGLLGLTGLATRWARDGGPGLAKAPMAK